MGMSADFEVAIEEGATIVRVGTALFGPRERDMTHGTRRDARRLPRRRRDGRGARRRRARRGRRAGEHVRAADPDPARRKQLEQALGIARRQRQRERRGGERRRRARGEARARSPACSRRSAGRASARSHVRSGSRSPRASRSRRSRPALPPGARIVRAMPNTPALVRAGATAFVASARARAPPIARSRARCSRASASPGRRPSEALLDAVTGLSGSGPAYVFVFLEALADAGVRMGLPRDAASALATQTVLGAATARAGDRPAPRGAQGPGDLARRHHHRRARAARGARLPRGRPRGRGRRDAAREGAWRVAPDCPRAPRLKATGRAVEVADGDGVPDAPRAREAAVRLTPLDIQNHRFATRLARPRPGRGRELPRAPGRGLRGAAARARHARATGCARSSAASRSSRRTRGSCRTRWSWRRP